MSIASAFSANPLVREKLAQYLALAYARGVGPHGVLEPVLRDLAVADAADLVGEGLQGVLGASALVFADGRRDSRANLPDPPLEEDQGNDAERCVEETGDALAALTARFQGGALELGQWRDLMGGALAEGLRAAYTLGNNRGLEPRMAAGLRAEMRDQGEYLDGFADDVASDVAPALAVAIPAFDPAGRPGLSSALALAARIAGTSAALGSLARAHRRDILAPLRLDARARLYAHKARAWYYRGATARAKRAGDYVVYWEGGTNSCPGCQQRAGGSPYAPDDLPGYPGDGGTPCKMNCRCTLAYRRESVGGA